MRDSAGESQRERRVIDRPGNLFEIEKVATKAVIRGKRIFFVHGFLHERRKPVPFSGSPS